MFSIFSNSGKITYGIKNYIVDTDADIAFLSTDGTPGSLAFVIKDSQYYMLNNQKTWIPVTLGGGGECSNIENLIYDGGTP